MAFEEGLELINSCQFRVLGAFDPLSVQGDDPGRVIGVALREQGYCGIAVADGDGFVAFDGAGLIDDRAVWEGVGVRAGVRGDVNAEEPEGAMVILWDGEAKELMKSVRRELEGGDGSV